MYFNPFDQSEPNVKDKFKGTSTIHEWLVSVCTCNILLQHKNVQMQDLQSDFLHTEYWWTVDDSCSERINFLHLIT